MKKFILFIPLILGIKGYAAIAVETNKEIVKKECTIPETGSSTITVDCGDGVSISSTSTASCTDTQETCAEASAVATICANLNASALAKSKIKQLAGMCNSGGPQ